MLPGTTVSDIAGWALTDAADKADYGYRSLTATGEAVSGSTVITKDTDLYVKWADTVRITFDPGDGGFNADSNVWTYEKGKEVTLSPYFQAIPNDAGKAFAQGIFVPFGSAEDDEVSAKRHGGFGSTNS